MQERHNSLANALELCLSCTNPSICEYTRLPVKYIIPWRINILGQAQVEEQNILGDTVVMQAAGTPESEYEWDQVFRLQVSKIRL